MALALKSTFGCLNGPFNASGATDHDCCSHIWSLRALCSALPPV